MKLMTAAEVARALGKGFGQRKIIQGAREGKYPYLQAGARMMFDADQIRDLIEQERIEKARGATLKEICEHTNLSYRIFRSYMDEGLIPYWKYGKGFRFDVEAVDQALAEIMVCNQEHSKAEENRQGN